MPIEASMCESEHVSLFAKSMLSLSLGAWTFAMGDMTPKAKMNDLGYIFSS